MWTIESKKLDDKTIHYFLLQENKRITYAQVLDLWIENADFRQFYNQVLVENPFSAYFWEVCPVNRNTLEMPFEFVLIDSPALSSIRADSQPFRTKFASESNIICFANLRKDAELVVPNARKATLDFPHLAAFVRTAASDWIDEFWQKVGSQMKANINQNKCWLSTSGLGVYWVHVRMDTVPKYYVHRPYRKSEFL